MATKPKTAQDLMASLPIQAYTPAVQDGGLRALYGTGGAIKAPDGKTYGVPAGTSGGKKATAPSKKAPATAQAGKAVATGQDQGGGMDWMAALRQLSGYTDRATAEMGQRQGQAEALLASRMGALAQDPGWRFARTLALRNAANPGINPAILDRMRGRALARATASSAGAARNVLAQLARRNIGGAAAQNAMALARNRGAIQNNQAQLGIDQMAAEAERADRRAAPGAIAGMAQAEVGQDTALASSLAATKRSYDPLNWLARVQALMNPIGNLSYAGALRG